MERVDLNDPIDWSSLDDFLGVLLLLSGLSLLMGLALIFPEIREDADDLFLRDGDPVIFFEELLFKNDRTESDIAYACLVNTLFVSELSITEDISADTLCLY